MGSVLVAGSDGLSLDYSGGRGPLGKMRPIVLYRSILATMRVSSFMLEVGNIVLHSLRNFRHDSAGKIERVQISNTPIHCRGKGEKKGGKIKMPKKHA